MKYSTFEYNIPQITQSLNKDLLSSYSYVELSKRTVETKIFLLKRRKIRSQDVGKRKEFEKLITEYYEEYERKKAKEEKYKAKIKNAPKMPRLSNSSGPIRFKRFKD